MEIRRRKKEDNEKIKLRFPERGTETRTEEGEQRERKEKRKKKVEREKGTKGVAREEAKLCPQAYCSFASDRTD